jgi:hypothetical protein
MALYGAHQARKTFGDLMPRSPLYGIWNVEAFHSVSHIDPARGDVPGLSENTGATPIWYPRAAGTAES